MSESCDHKFVPIRQETVSDGGFHPGRDTFDVFFCEKCLQYKKVKVKREEESRDRFGYEVVWRNT